jgi:hypothetical protein
MRINKYRNGMKVKTVKKGDEWTKLKLKHILIM